MAIHGVSTRTVNLDPGEMYLGVKPVEVHTVLGSCVSVVLFHPQRRMGAMCHGKLPSRKCDHPACGLKICRAMGDFVSCSLRFMLSWFDLMGVSRKELEVKLFGGAMMFMLDNQPRERSIAVGKRNVETAMDLIRGERLHLVASDVGGPWGRRIVFHAGTGEVKLQRIRKTELELASISGVPQA
ncbi:MAG: chemotaxis protein CheD [Magnetococcales bacterium]|nr:chemotaxis protein CheD [Magnetococcales bacterium]MBF0151447.1 chemotaxis protein CheD [Magnetococcales bacterium]MBF0174418.1 chemotaxis protein CheD [Magnetococcales bacterium]MBF0348425.1 chemotaxis protein CheD [Magnetococcales bacterium]MBF0632461.1 chemotaxis protein CheD [Magnetococcales bacterium]